MKRIKEWIAGLNIRAKLIFYSYVFVTPVLILISCLLFFHNYANAVKSEEANCMSDVKRLSDSISEIQSSIMEMGIYISINDEIIQILSSDDPGSLNADAQLWIHQAPMQIIRDMMALDGQMKTIALYPENGVIPYLQCMDHSAYLRNMEVVRSREIFQLADEHKGKAVWQRVGKYMSDTYQDNRSEKIVMYRMIYDLAQKERLGYLVIGSSARVFDVACQNALHDEDETIVVMSSYGAELCSCGAMERNDLDEILSQDFSKYLKKNGTGMAAYGNYRIFMCKDASIGTITYEIVPKVDLHDFGDTIIIAPLALLFGVLIGLYPVMIMLSNIITKPLHNLSVAMEQFKHGDFNQQVEVHTRDEIGAVTVCFNSMVEDIRDLIDRNYVLTLKERESELDILQAQINPHFLYNALDSLYWKALESGNEEIGEDILSLSQLFRLVLNRGNGIVTVRLEMELLERYLHIQKMRFGKRLEYEFKLDPAVMEEKIPKLILQPFVENAIVHGFEKGERDFLLTIAGKREGDFMAFSIVDSGVGMSREQLQAIWESPDTRQYASQRIGRYAIKNVKERLELVYKDNYKLQIESRKGQGTTVRITVPCGLKEKQEHEQRSVDCG